MNIYQVALQKEIKREIRRVHLIQLRDHLINITVNRVLNKISRIKY